MSKNRDKLAMAVKALGYVYGGKGEHQFVQTQLYAAAEGGTNQSMFKLQPLESGLASPSASANEPFTNFVDMLMGMKDGGTPLSSLITSMTELCKQNPKSYPGLSSEVAGTSTEGEYGKLIDEIQGNQIINIQFTKKDILDPSLLNYIGGAMLPAAVMSHVIPRMSPDSTLPPINNPYLIAQGVEHIFAGLKDPTGGETPLAQKFNTNPLAPSKDKPNLGVVNIFDPHMNISNRDTGLCALFANGIPSMEISKCVPYVDVKIITPHTQINVDGTGAGTIGEGISNLRFMYGEGQQVPGADGDMNRMLAAAPTGDVVPNAFQTKKERVAVTVAGMELFTSPQTAIPFNSDYRDLMPPDVATGESSASAGRGTPVIDKMRPFLTLKQISITVQPAYGMSGTKTAKMDIRLHDRSRLKEIGPFIRPSALGDIELLIEYGWSHPDGDIASNNPYGWLLDSLRSKEKFGVRGAAMTFTNAGEVDISVDLFTKGTFDMVNKLVINTAVSASSGLLDEALKALNEEVIKLKKQASDDGSVDIIGEEFIGEINSISEQAFMSAEVETALKDLVEGRGTKATVDDETLMTTKEEKVWNSEDYKALREALTEVLKQRNQFLGDDGVASKAMQNILNLCKAPYDPWKISQYGSGEAVWKFLKGTVGNAESFSTTKQVTDSHWVYTGYEDTTGVPIGVGSGTTEAELIAYCEDLAGREGQTYSDMDAVTWATESGYLRPTREALHGMMTGDFVEVTRTRTVKTGTALKSAPMGSEDFVSFAKLATIMIAGPLAATKKYDEIQLIFYPMNAFSMYARHFTVGTMPCHWGTLEKVLTNLFKVQKSATIAQMMSIVNRLYFSNKANPVYGFSNLYTTDKTGAQKAMISVDPKEITPEERAKFNAAYAQYNDDHKTQWDWSEEQIQGLKTILPNLRRTIMSDCYGEECEHKFKKPQVTLFTECVPMASGEGNGDKGTILRLHFYDAACTSYEGFTQMWEAQRRSSTGLITRAFVSDKDEVFEGLNPGEFKPAWKAKMATIQTAIDDLEIFEIIDPAGKVIENVETLGERDAQTLGKSYLRIKGGSQSMRYLFHKHLPSFKYGTEHSALTAAALSTSTDPAMATIHMQRAMNDADDPSGDPDAGMPLTSFPGKLSLTMFGNPLLQYGQQFFCDFATGTTMDDVYGVVGLTHTLTPGSFTTGLEMTPLQKFGQFKSPMDRFGEMIAKAAAAEEEAKSRDFESGRWDAWVADRG